MMRVMLYEAAHIMLVRSTKWSWLKAWAMQIAKRRGLFPGPPELSAVNPYAVHDHGEPTRQRHDRLFQSAAPGNLL